MARCQIEFLLRPILLGRMGRFFISTVKKVTHIFLLLIFISAYRNLFAQTDSIKSYEVSDVVVSASRSSLFVQQSPVAVTLIQRELLYAQTGNTFSSALAGVSGLFIKSYGGNRAVETVSLRGMAAEHTVVLVDGIRSTNFQNGLSDLGISSSSNIERIEIVKGGNSSLYGADAVGGIINVITKKPSEHWRTQIDGSVGSNNYSSVEISGSGKLFSNFSFDGRVRKEYAKNNFSFHFDDGMTKAPLRRENADFSFTNVSAKIVWHDEKSFSSFLSLYGNRAERGSPGAVTTINQTGKARLHDDFLRALLHAEWSNDARMQLHCNASLLYANETYSDPNIIMNSSPLSNEYLNRVVTFSPEMRMRISYEYAAVVGGEFEIGNIASNAVKKSERVQSGFFIAQEILFHSLSDLTLFPSLRFDWFSDVEDEVSPKIGMNIALSSRPNIHFRSSFGKSFRVPSFNDLYWRAGGNPLLRPEHSVSFDCGIVGEENIFGTLFFEANYFFITTKERILWMPYSGTLWTPRNIGKVQSEGVECEVRWLSSNRALQFSSNITLNAVQKKNEDFPGDPTYNKFLIYLPQQIFTGSVLYTPERWSFFLQYMWSSFRYATAYNDKFLPHYDIVNCSAIYRLDDENVSPFYKLEITNCFNTSYQSIALYPMPLREFRFSFGVEWK